MRALVLEAFDGVAGLRVLERPTPRPAEGEALLAVHAAGVNPSDLKNAEGLMPHTRLPRIPGRDFAGVVVEGPDEWLGVEVFGTGGELGFSRDGSHAEWLTLPVAALCRRPAALAMAEAAAVGVAYVTAWLGLVERARVGPDDRVLVIGASGAVGSAGASVARMVGARVLEVSREPPPGAFPAAPEHLAEAVRDATDGQGVTVVLDTVGGAYFEAGLAALAPGGRLVSLTLGGERRASFDMLDFYRRELSLFGVNSLRADSATCAALLERMRPLFESGSLVPPRIQLYPLSEAQDAYTEVGRRSRRQKVVLSLVQNNFAVG